MRARQSLLRQTACRREIALPRCSKSQVAAQQVAAQQVAAQSVKPYRSSHIGQAMRKQIDRILAAFEFNLVPIIVTTLTCYVLFAPAQSREIHRAFAQRLATLQTLPMTSSSPELWSALTTSLYMLGGLIALSVLLWLACRENIPDAEFPEGKAAVGARKLVSRGLAILPFLALSFGLYAASSADMTEIKDLLTKIKEANLQDAGGDPSSVHAIAVDW